MLYANRSTDRDHLAPASNRASCARRLHPVPAASSFKPSDGVFTGGQTVRCDSVRRGSAHTHDLEDGEMSKERKQTKDNRTKAGRDVEAVRLVFHRLMASVLDDLKGIQQLANKYRGLPGFEWVMRVYQEADSAIEGLTQELTDLPSMTIDEAMELLSVK